MWNRLCALAIIPIVVALNAFASGPVRETLGLPFWAYIAWCVFSGGVAGHVAVYAWFYQSRLNADRAEFRSWFKGGHPGGR